MGWFSSSYATYVSSTAYNMAGEVIERPDYLKSTVARGALMSGQGLRTRSLGDVIVNGQLRGPQLKQRAFFRWAENNQTPGRLIGEISTQSEVDPAVLAPFISIPVGDTLEIDTAILDDGDIIFWAQRHILNNSPELYTSDWTVEWQSNLQRMLITYEDTSTESVILTDFNSASRYIIAYYRAVGPTTSTVPVEGEGGADVGARPDRTGWDVVSETNVASLYPAYVFYRTTVDNGVDPPVVTNPPETTYNIAYFLTNAEYYKETPLGAVDTAGGTGLEFFIETDTHSNAINGVYVWETVSDTTDEFGVRTIEEERNLQWYEGWTYQVFNFIRTEYPQVADEAGIFLYEIGSGNAVLDALQNSVAGYETEFYPVIPLRINNKPISHPDFDDDYADYAKTYERVFGDDISNVLAQIEDNPNVGDIDYSYVVHGVELNTQENHGKRYLYEFFRNLIQFQETSAAEVDEWTSGWIARIIARAAMRQWEIDNDAGFGDYFNAPRPTLPDTSTARPYSTLRVRTTSTLGYDVRLKWLTIDENIYTGVRPGMVSGDFEWETLSDIVVPGEVIFFGPFIRYTAPDVRIARHNLWWQDGENSYRSLTLIGMQHSNHIYDGTAVYISVAQALADADDSGFVVPLHYPSMLEMSLRTGNEFAISNRIVVFNSYTVVKTKWYEKGIFKVIISIVVAVVVTLVFGPAAGAGVLGTNAAVGASLGFAAGTMTAVVVGAVVNAIAAMILLSVIEGVATSIFGDELGAIIATVVTVLAGNAIGNYHETGSMAVNWGEIMKADNLTKLTSATANIVAEMAQMQVGRYQADLDVATDEYEREEEKIERMTADILGYGGGVINPLLFREIQDSSAPNVETADAFLKRTLLTGTDIAEMSLNMIGGFAELTLKLDRSI